MSLDSTKNLRNVAVVGTGSYLPERIVTNKELEKFVDTSDEWILSRTGIKERRIAADDQATSDMAAEAAQRALLSADISADEIDVIIVATLTPDVQFPNTACLVQNLIGAKKAACFSVEAACSGFVYVMELARLFITAGSAETVLVIGSEKMSSVLNWDDRGSCVLFGDGAGAAILKANDQGAGTVFPALLKSDGEYSDLLSVPGGGSRLPATADTVAQQMHYLRMDGREVYKHAVTEMSNAVKEILNIHSLTVDDIACIIPHQANKRIIDAILRRLSCPKEKVFVNLDKYGNTSAASVGIGLDEAVRSGTVKNGDLIILVAFGGGFTWGANLLKWGTE